MFSYCLELWITDGITVRCAAEEIFEISETQAEAVVEPDDVADDVRGKSVSAVAGRVAVHLPTLPPAAST